MRKRILSKDQNAAGQTEEWLNVENIATVEVTSEDPNFPIEAALAARGQGWRAGNSGEQIIRLVFDAQQTVNRIVLEFYEPEITRTQEFTLRYSQAGQPLKELRRQQWNFSPQGSTSEIEDFRFNLEGVAVLELSLKPDLNASDMVATLKAWRIA
jgi:hypothetical protein